MIKDITNQRYGKLTVLRLAKLEEKKISKFDTSSQWFCKCDCGKEIITKKSLLRTGRSKSCGCLATENARKALKGKRPKGIESALKRKFNAYKFNAQKRNLVFELTIEEFHNLIIQDCRYCGLKPNQQTCIYRSQDIENTLIHNGIDRLNNDVGYTLANAVPCCKYCNQMKMDLSFDFFLNHIKQIINYQVI